MKKGLKWFGIICGALFGFFVLAAAIVPFLVDVDQFRPKIVETASQYINGKLELGKLKLSLWGQVRVEVDGASVLDAKGRRVLAVKDVFFHIPFSSLLSGSPLLTFRMRKPEVVVIKDGSGINVLSLVKAQPKSAVEAPTPTPEAAAKASGATAQLPGIVARARLGIEMLDARLSYTDKTTDLTSTVESLNVRVKDLSLARPTEVEISAELNTRMGKILEVKGPAVLTATAKPTFKGAEFEKAAVTVRGDLDEVEIRYGDLFYKTAGIPMNVQGSLSATMDSAEINDIVARFHNAELKLSGGIAGFKDPGGPQVRVNAVSNAIGVAPWARLVPMLKAYELSGNASFKADAKGLTEKLQYHAEFAVQKLQAKAPLLKAQPTIDAFIKVVTDRVEKMEMTFKAPGNDLRVSGTVVSFTKPKVNVQVASTGMDLDQLIEFPKVAGAGAIKGNASAASSGAAGSGKKGEPSNFDKMLDPLRDNAIAAATDATISFQLKYLKAYNVRMEPIEGQFSFRGLTASLDRFRMGLFDGAILAHSTFELKPTAPRYAFSVDVSGLDLKKAVTSQLEMFKNTIYGKATFKMSGKGMSFNPEPAIANLEASGNLSVAGAQFATLDIAHMATDAINKALQGLEGKIPQVKGKKISTPPSSETGYEKVAAGFTIAKGVFTMPDFAAISGKYRGIDVKGATMLGLKDYKLNAAWELIDTNNLTGARNVTVESNGVRVDPLLAEPNQPVRFPIHVAGTVFAPVPDYAAVPEAFAKVALANIARAAEVKVKSEIQARAGAEARKLRDKAPAEIKKALKGLGF